MALMHKDWAELLKKMDELLERDFGKRCPDFEPSCIVCTVWQDRDRFVEHAKLSVDQE